MERRNGLTSRPLERALNGTGAAQRAPAILEVDGVAKSFGDRAAVVDVSFSVAARELVAVLGPSGAGKTTLFRCISGLARPDAGQVLFDGAAVHALRRAERRQIAVVFQQFNLVRRLTALQNVLGGRLGHVPGWRGALRQFQRADTLFALECLERVGMLEHAGQRADTLSGGQQQRVAIARALAQEPRLIVADEPVASLDPSSATGVLKLLRDIALDDRVAVICSLHQVTYARAYATRIIGLTGGRVLIDAATGTLADGDFESLYGTQTEPGSGAPATSQEPLAPAPDATHA